MRAVIQRVSHARVSVQDNLAAEIGRGLVVLVGVGYGDLEKDAAWLADKIAHLRIFEDDQGKSNLSLLDVKGEALVVSQFTLFADARKGRRPSFINAAPPEVAEPLIARFAESLASHGLPVKSGLFQAHMLVEIHNDGPVTIILDSPGGE